MFALLGCQGDWVPPVPDGTYKVTGAALPAADGEWRAYAAVFDDEGSEANELAEAIQFMTSNLSLPLPAVSLDVQLAIEDEAVTFVNEGQAGAEPIPFTAHNNDVLATGGEVTLGLQFAGYDPVQLTISQAAVLLDPGSLNGNLGGLISTDQLESKVYPTAIDIMNTLIKRDCTLVQTPTSVCGCQPSTDGAELVGIIGSGCLITEESFHATGLFASLIAPYPPGFMTIGVAIQTERL